MSTVPDDAGQCPLCGNTVYVGLAHSCSTAVKFSADIIAMSMTPCGRCGVVGCNDPDSKACSDNCIARQTLEVERLTRKLAEAIGQCDRARAGELVQRKAADKAEAALAERAASLDRCYDTLAQSNAYAARLLTERNRACEQHEACAVKMNAAEAESAAMRKDEITAELTRAVAKFPTWPTDPLHALAVLGEEFGELTKAMLQLTYEPHKTSADEVRSEAHVQPLVVYQAAMDWYRADVKAGCTRYSFSGQTRVLWDACAAIKESK